MTEEQIKEKIDELVNSEFFQRHIDRKTKQILKSGSLDIERYENDYLLPKIILSVILKSLARQYAPIHLRHKKIADNLENFV